jgi:Flp pilus assembly protein TadG
MTSATAALAKGVRRQTRKRLTRRKRPNSNRPIKNRLIQGILTLELVLALPIMLAVILVLVEIGTYLLAVQAIQGAAMVGAREASLPSATSDRVQAAVVASLSGWSYAGSLEASDIQIANDVPIVGSVSVAVSIDATKAVINPLAMVPGFDLTGTKVSAQFVMRRE